MSENVQKWQRIEIDGGMPVEFLKVPGGTLYRQSFVVQHGSAYHELPKRDPVVAWMTWTVPDRSPTPSGKAGA